MTIIVVMRAMPESERRAMGRSLAQLNLFESRY